MPYIKNRIFIFCTTTVLCIYSSLSIAAEIDQTRIRNIAEHVIKMQIINDPNAAQNLKSMAKLIVNSNNPQDMALILDLIPKQGIAQYLRELNTQGLTANTAKQMLKVINIEIDQSSQIFKSCKVLESVEKKATDLYSVQIECQVPSPSRQAIEMYQQQISQINRDDPTQYKIQHFQISQSIFTQSITRPFRSELMIDTSKPPIFRPVIEDDDYFPNVVINQRTQPFLSSKVAGNHSP